MHVNLKKIADLNVKPKTIKHLEENTGENFCNQSQNKEKSRKNCSTERTLPSLEK